MVLDRARLRRTALVLSLLALQGCTVFSDYNETTEEGLSQFRSGNFQGALNFYAEHLEDSNDGLLYHLEASQAAMLAGDRARAETLMDTAYQQVDAYYIRGLDGEGIAQSIGALTVNDKTLPYEGEAFEHLFLCHYIATNVYLQGHNDDEVIQAVTLTNYIDQRAQQLYEEELRAYNSEVSNTDLSGIDSAELSQSVSNSYSEEYGDLSGAEDVYNINFINYAKAFFYEACNTHRSGQDYNDAWLELGYVINRFPDVEFLQQDYIRLAREAGLFAEANQAQENWGVTPHPEDYGSVALLLESGFAPHKKELKVTFPTYKGAGAIAIPLYEGESNPVHHARLVVGDQSQDSVILSDMDSIAFRYHKDRMPLIIARVILRAVIKVGIQSGGTVALEAAAGDSVEGQLGALAFSIGASIWNVASEQADLRCWRTLPQTLQASRVYLPAGTYPAQLELCGAGGGVVSRVDLGQITVESRGHVLVNARTIGTSAQCTIR